MSDISNDQMDELLGAIVDAENLYMSMYREVDEDTRKVYGYLFKVSILVFSEWTSI